MISKTKLSKRTSKKRNTELVETLKQCKRNPSWISVGKTLSRSRKDKLEANLDNIDKQAKEGDRIIIPGKVLSQGKISKKIRVIALAFSKTAREKLEEQKIESSTILEEINTNPKAEGVKIFTL
jgi:large subunit ribosomal protein L18e